MNKQFSTLPSGQVNLVIIDSGSVLEISSDTNQVTFTPIRIENRESADFLIQCFKDKRWLMSESKTSSGGRQFKALIPAIYLSFIESVANCDLHNDGHRTAYDALKVWHAQGKLDSDELEDIMTMFE